jgi:hypothetical protein
MPETILRDLGEAFRIAITYDLMLGPRLVHRAELRRHRPATCTNSSPNRCGFVTYPRPVLFQIRTVPWAKLPR